MAVFTLLTIRQQRREVGYLPTVQGTGGEAEWLSGLVRGFQLRPRGSASEANGH